MRIQGIGVPDVREVVRYDLSASLVVFLVALPLSLGIAIASGAPVLAGLIAAVIGGVVAGLLGGSRLQVSGPAAGLTVVVADMIASFGWRVTCFITVGAGILQLLFGISRVAGAALGIAPVVVHAMLAGIGITIALQQVHVLLGGSSASGAWENVTTLPAGIADVNLSDALVGGTVIAVLLAWPFLPASARKVPGPLVAIVGATLMVIALGLDVDRISIDGSFFEAISLPELPDNGWSAVLLGILTVALIASVESLLSAVAVDKMHTGPRADLNREMLGQGSANIASGMLGGLPVTGVIVRSTANVAAGARTRASAVLHGVWVLVFAALLTGLVEQIPTAALAGLLVVIGIQLVKLAHMRVALRTGDMWVYGITVTSVVFLNLLEGVAIGLAVAIGLLVWRVVRIEVTSEPSGTEGSRKWVVRVRGSLSFLSLPKLNKALVAVPDAAHLTLELDTDFLDHAASEMLEDFRWAHEAGGGTVLVVEKGRARLSDAPRRPPRRHTTGFAGLTPWRSRVASESAAAQDRPAALRSIMGGVNDYEHEHADALQAMLADVTETQDPDSLFVTCADSRLLPNIITASGPGDLFTVRNVGNLIPADPGDDVSVEAALEFAVGDLGVTSIVVCGHSSCGAMHALLEDEPSVVGTADMVEAGPIRRWLRHAIPSLAALRLGHPAGRAAAEMGLAEVDQLAVVNVAKQMETLTRHPLVGRAAAESRVKIVGLYFDIATARVFEVTPRALGPVTDSVPEDASARG